MSDYRRYNPGDDIHFTEGDAGFLGVDMRRDASLLAAGMVSAAINKRFRNGCASTRSGIIKLPFVSHLGAWFPLTFPIDFEQLLPIGITIHGTGIFDDPDDERWILIAADGKVFRCLQGLIVHEVPLPAGIVIDGPVFFMQGISKLFLFRGEAKSTLVMNSVYDGFTEVTQENSGAGNGTGTLTIPNSAFGLFFQNRAFVVHGRDEIMVSDALNLTRYSITNSFRINKGSSDRLTGVYAWNDTTIVVAKERSVYTVSNLIPNALGDYDQPRLGVVTREWGIIAPRSMVATGTDLMGLSRRGVVSIQQTTQNLLQAVDMPVSEPIQPLIDRINWRYAAGAVAAFWDNKYYLAVPMDDAEVTKDELVIHATYGTGPGAATGVFVVSDLLVGRVYRWNPGLNDGNAVNGATVYPNSGGSVDIKVVDTNINLNGVPGMPVTSSLRQVFRGVNNAVLIYDTINKAWCGYDRGENLMVKEFLLAMHDESERLYFAGDDGYLNLYEEGFEDDVLVEVRQPYIDIVVDQCPKPGDSIQINGGDLVTATLKSVNAIGAATYWGCANLAVAAQNLYEDRNGLGGFAHVYAPNTTVTRVPGGIRVQATNATLPAIGFAGTSNWAYLTRGYGTAVTGVPVVDHFLSRGYMPKTEDERIGGRLSPKRFNRAVLNLKTWDALLTIKARTDGQAEDRIAAVVQKDRTKPYKWGQQRHDPMNSGDDHAAPYREDYSVLLGESDLLSLGVNEVDPEILQEATEKVELRGMGKYCQIEINGYRGRSEIAGIEVASTTGSRRTGAIA